MENEGELDITSEPTLGPLLPVEKRAGQGGNRGERGRTARKGQAHRLQVHFKCCNVYALLPIPEGVMNAQLSSWRFHCPRCAKLVEIPIP